MKGTIDFNANGKLLLTGEYLVIVGATALAFPVRYGQSMRIQETGTGEVEWVSSVGSVPWFHAAFDAASLKLLTTDKKKIAIHLKKVLAAAHRLNPEFLTGPSGWKVRVSANYPLEWGLGSSATLYSLVAGWAGVSVFDLHRSVSNGSGYDVACAGSKGLIYYQLRKGHPEITPAQPGTALRENTYFAYLGNKRNSAREVAAFLSELNYSEIDLTEVSRLSTEICETGSAADLIRLVNEHEFILSTILKRDPIANRYRSFNGTVKSLGAWGGDFAMFVSSMEPGEVARDLRQMGFLKIFRFSELEIKA